MMRSACEQKEDIRLHIVDLEKKLAESEEERCKLEKTCDVLIRAFREQERMRYKVLNKKYEKFLEDCLVRSQRNDIILRSLCRIEDRSRTLFAKTERLKLLKDRYISYLKLNKLKQKGTSFGLWSNPPLRTTDENTNEDLITKTVHWKSPLTLSPRTDGEFGKAQRDSLSRNDSMHASIERYIREKEDDFQEHKSQRNNSARTLDVDFHLKALTVETKREEAVSDRSRIMRETTSSEIAGRKQHPTNAVSHLCGDGQGGQKVNDSPRKAMEYPERECREPKYRLLSENEDIKPNEIERIPRKALGKLLKNNQCVVTSSPKSSFSQENDPQNKCNVDSEDIQGLSQEKNISSGSPPKTDKTLPLGLDGIDYQNETYPESYYEQPIRHHNHTSIASDVILEEDETEQELEDDKNFSFDRPQMPNPNENENTWDQGRSFCSVVETPMTYALNKESEPPSEGHPKGEDIGDVFENVKSQEESDSEKTSEAKQSGIHSGKPKSSSSEKSEKSQTAGKSNLIHMLESDSESFQIEHGDGIPENEDSDFDFSFSKN